MKKILSLKLILVSTFIFIASLNNAEARRGCCSWHGGVCTYTCPDGVSTGYQCCDGTPFKPLPNVKTKNGVV